ncbi:MAG: hypothetical protein ACTSU2_13705 [Promethearchaeota archaeon]
MSERQIVEVFLNWVKDGGLAGWIEHYLQAGDEAKLQEIAQVYQQLKAAFGF